MTARNMASITPDVAPTEHKGQHEARSDAAAAAVGAATKAAKTAASQQHKTSAPTSAPALLCTSLKTSATVSAAIHSLPFTDSTGKSSTTQAEGQITSLGASLELEWLRTQYCAWLLAEHSESINRHQLGEGISAEERTQYEQKYEALAKRHKATCDEVEKLKTMNARLHNELDKAVREKLSIRNEIANFMTENALLIDENEQFRMMEERLRIKIKVLKEYNKELRGEDCSGEEKQSTENILTEALRKQDDLVEDQNTKLRETVKTLQATIDSLNNSGRYHDGIRLKRPRASIPNGAESIDVDNSNASSDNRIESRIPGSVRKKMIVLAKIEATVKENHFLKFSNREFSSAVSVLQSKVKELEDKITLGSTFGYADLEAANRRLRLQVGELEAECASLEKSLQETKLKEISQADLEAIEVTDNIEVPENHLCKRRRQGVNVLGTIDGEEAKLGNLHGALNTVAKDLKEKNSCLKDDNEKLRSRLRTYVPEQISHQCHQRLTAHALIDHVRNSFVCTGQSDLLFAAIAKFCDRGVSSANHTAQLSKPILLIHQVHQITTRSGSRHPSQVIPADTDVIEIDDEEEHEHEVQEELSNGRAIQIEEGDKIEEEDEAYLEDAATIESEHEEQKPPVKNFPSVTKVGRRTRSSSRNSSMEQADKIIRNTPTKKDRLVRAVIHLNSVQPDAHPSKKACTRIEVDTPAVTENDLKILYGSAPWEAMYIKRPRLSRVVDYSQLGDRAKAWVKKVLDFQSKFRRELWEQQHWIVVSAPRVFLAKRLEGQVVAGGVWTQLRQEAEDLIAEGELSPDLWRDPFIWSWPNRPREWRPRSCYLLHELAVVDQSEPERCFFVNCIDRHPFFINGLCYEYEDRHPLPAM